MKILQLMLALVWMAGAQYPGTTVEWDFMLMSAPTEIDIRAGRRLHKQDNTPNFVAHTTANWRFPVETGLGWSFEGEEVACTQPAAAMNMGGSFATHLWIYMYDFTSKQTVW